VKFAMLVILAYFSHYFSNQTAASAQIGKKVITHFVRYTWVEHLAYSKRYVGSRSLPLYRSEVKDHAVEPFGNCKLTSRFTNIGLLSFLRALATYSMNFWNYQDWMKSLADFSLH
jgi:hypothetical protein